MFKKFPFARISSIFLVAILSFLILPQTSYAISGGGGIHAFGGDPFGTDAHATWSRAFNVSAGQIGDFTYSYDIEVPPGRKGTQPQLALSYSSNASPDAGMFGHGWSVSIPLIQRFNKYGAETLYSDNQFFASQAGELTVDTTDTTLYGSKNESGSFQEYRFIDNSYWQMTDKAGTLYTFGQTANARQADPNDSTKVYTWMLEEVRDSNGNFVSYTYFKDAGQIYPDTITYTNTDLVSGLYEVVFLREARTDYSANYKTGFSVETKYRISEIQTKVNANRVTKYAITYVTGDNSSRSLLSTITKSGKDLLGLVAVLPSVNFTYQTFADAFADDWVLDSNYTIPTTFINTYYDQGVRMADVNGDGLTDILKSQKTNDSWNRAVFLNKGDGTGWTQDANYIINAYIVVDNGTTVKNYGTQFIDVNGDNHADIVHGINDPGQATQKTILINNADGTGWTQDANFILPDYLINNNNDTGMRFAEVNGDGLVDIIFGGGSSRSVHTNNGDGTGWTLDANYTVPIPFVESGYDRGVRLVDINADGLVDILKSQKTNDSWNTAVYINKGDGTGWILDNNYSIPTYFIIDNSTVIFDAGTRFSDINGDGLIDILHSYYDGSATINGAYLNKGDGTGWVLTTDYTAPFVFANSTYQQGVNAIDVNGDGRADFVKSIGSTQAVQIHNGKKVDALILISTAEGGTITPTYKEAHQYFDEFSGKLNIKLPFPVNTVESIVKDDGFGNLSTANYEYSGADYYYVNPYNRQFSGFHKNTKTDSFNQTTTTYYHQNNGLDTATGEQADHRALIGKPYRSEVRDNSNNLYDVSLKLFDTFDLGNDRAFAKQIQTVTLNYDGNDSHRDIATTNTYDNANGNILSQTAYGEVTANATTGSFTDISTDKTTTNYTYVTSPNIGGLPSMITTLDNNGSKISETRNYFDGLVFGTATKGNLTKEEAWLNPSNTYINKTYTYNTHGLATSETDYNGNTISYSYDSNYLYPTTITNAKSQATTLTYNLATGKPTQTTDPNGTIQKTTFDGLGRTTKTEATSPNGALTVMSETTYTDTDMPRSIYTKQYLNSPTTPAETYTYIDGADRAIQTRSSMATAGNWSVTTTEYDSVGRVAKQYLPIAKTSPAYGSTGQANSQSAIFTYDALDRPTSVTTGVGTTNTNRDQWVTTITDANGNQKKQYLDARDNLIQVDEGDGASTFSTYYNYSALNNLIKITDAEGNEREFTYDSLGRQLTNELPHAPSASASIYTYTYDNNSNKLSQTDPLGTTINWSYDQLNRQLTESANATTHTTNTYDTAINGIGKLAQSVTPDYSITYSYDLAGNVNKEERAIEGAVGAEGGINALPLYDDAWNAEWGNWSWNTSVNESGTNPINNGSFALDVNYLGNWAGMYFSRTDPYTSAGAYPELNFKINIGSAEGETISILLYGTYDSGCNCYPQIGGGASIANYVTGGLQPNTWHDVTIPLTDIYPSLDLFSGIVFQSATLASVTFDDIQLLSGALPIPSSNNIDIYTDVLGAGWEDQSWSIASNYSNTNPVHTGSFSHELIYPGQWDAWYLHYPTPINTANYAEISLKINTGASGNEQIFINLLDQNHVSKGYVQIRDYVSGGFVPNTWHDVVIPLTDIVPSGTIIENIMFQNGETSSQTIYLDEVRINEFATIAMIESTSDLSSLFTSLLDNLFGRLSNLVTTAHADEKILFPKSKIDTATKHSDGFKLKWSKENGSSYAIQRSIAGSPYVTIASDITEDKYTDTNNYADVPFIRYRILTTDSAGITMPSAPIFAYPDAPKIKPPGKLAKSAETAVKQAKEKAKEQSNKKSNKDQLLSTTQPISQPLTFGATGGIGGGAINDVIIYENSLNPNYMDWSWPSVCCEPPPNISSNWSHTATYASNPNSIAITTPTNWNALFLQSATAVDSTLAPILHLHVNIGTNEGEQLYIGLFDANMATDPSFLGNIPLSNYLPTINENTWYEVNIPISDITAVTSIGGVYIQSDVPATFYIDDLSQITNQSAVFVTQYTHNDYNLPDTITYPDNTHATHTYDINGQLTTLANDTTLLISGITRNAVNQITNIYYGNGVNELKTYDADKENRLINNTVTDGTSNLQNVSYTYDNVGNVKTINDTGTELPSNKSFNYDNLDRLTSATINSDTRTYQYSPIGNILNKTDESGSISYSYTNPQHPHAVTSTGATTYTYNTNGSFTQKNTPAVVSNYTYDYKNRLQSADINGNTHIYTYDSNTQRVHKELSDGTRTSYIGTLAEVDGLGNYTNYFFANTGANTNSRIATQNPTEGTVYNTGDHLGSASLQTNTTGNVIQKIDYYAFGDERTNTKTTTHDTHFTYTDQEKDNESGLMYYGARYYDTASGRFTSVDPASLIKPNEFLFDPQQLNLYSYVANNPLKYVDDNGEFLDTFADAIFIAWSAYELGKAIVTGGDIKGATINFALDGGSLFVPFVAGAGTLRRVSSHADEVVDVARTLNAVDVGIDLTRGADVTKIKSGVKSQYKRPSNATTPQQRASVQGRTCVDCGKIDSTMTADHKTPLVKEYYETGKINTTKMRDLNSVQPQCTNCSSKQGAGLSNYSKSAKQELGI